jgi:ABC-type lipoprotein export system ATPase subunit
MSAAAPVIEVRGVSKNYSGLRPLRIAELTIGAGERVSVGGLDAGAGELLVNLVTGASVPDAGEIRIFGQRTADIPDGDAWLDLLERFGIVSPRAVLLEGSTLQQNLAMPFTLEIGDRAGTGRSGAADREPRTGVRSRRRTLAGSARWRFAGGCAGARPPGAGAGAESGLHCDRTPDGRCPGCGA